MHFLSLPVVVLGALLCAAHVSARSTQGGPLRQIATASQVSLDTIELARRDTSHGSGLRLRSETHTNGLRLNFRAFDQDFHLHLQPNHDLLHPDGTTVTYHAMNDTTGESYIKSTQILYPGDVSAYHGVVLHPTHTRRRFNEDQAGVRRDIYKDSDIGVVGRASILLHDDGAKSGLPYFEGSFDWLGNVHHVHTTRSYLAKRQHRDPLLEPHHEIGRSLILHRDSDIVPEGEDLAHLSQGCNSDGLGYNNHSHLVLSQDNNDDQSSSVYSFFKLPTPPRFSRRGMSTSWNDLFVKRSQDHSTPDVMPETYTYDSLDDYLEPTFRRRQATGNDIGGGGNQTNSYENVIGSTAGCPNSARVVYAGIASDCAYTQRQGSQDDARTEILNNMNSVSNLYRSTFNISIGVVELDVRSATCPSSPAQNARWNIGCGSDSIDVRLSEFSQWRAQQPGNGVGLWHLMTACNSGSEIGVAWLGTLCMTGASGSGDQVVSGTGVSSVTTQQWQVIAHEMGHNFGAIHDCTNGCTSGSTFATQNGGAPCCPLSASTCNANAAFIMNPSSRSNIENFSQCSIGNICTLLGQGLNTSCIATPGSRSTLSTQQCGNGILEPGEECDAGPNGSQCCTTQCRLTSNAQCDPATSPCCTSSCRYAASSQVCRPAVDSLCDTTEYCNGTSASCPTDIKRDDGASCGSGLSCANGFCTSRDQQCQQASTSTMSFSSACSASSSTGCQLTCQSPNSINQCLVLQQTFVDGTSCGYGGRCRDGECQSGSWQDTFRNWYTSNLRISIPVTIVIGIIVMLILWAIVRRCCCGSARQRRQGSKSARGSRYTGAPPPMRNGPYTPSTPNSHLGQPASYETYGTSNTQGPTVPTAARSSHRSSNWVDPHQWNGAGGAQR